MPWCISPVPSRIPCALLGRAMRQAWCRLKSWRGHLPQRLVLGGDRCAPRPIRALLACRRNCIAQGRRMHERHAVTRARRAMTQLVPRSCGSPLGLPCPRAIGACSLQRSRRCWVAMSYLRWMQRRKNNTPSIDMVQFNWIGAQANTGIYRYLGTNLRPKAQGPRPKAQGPRTNQI